MNSLFRPSSELWIFWRVMLTWYWRYFHLQYHFECVQIVLLTYAQSALLFAGRLHYFHSILHFRKLWPYFISNCCASIIVHLSSVITIRSIILSGVSFIAKPSNPCMEGCEWGDCWKKYYLYSGWLIVTKRSFEITIHQSYTYLLWLHFSFLTL